MSSTRVPAAPRPVLLQAHGQTCVGWWHAPATAPDPELAHRLPRGWVSGGALPLAAVLASSWGAEDIAGYEGLRALAQALAAGGIGTLRFEWPDMGDSSADGPETTHADQLAAFDAAAVQTLALSGCERLAFVGLRLGALVAAHAAAARSDVDALVALLPVANGRAFVRAQPAPVVDPASPRLPAGGTFDPAQLPVMLGGFTRTVRQVEALSVLKWPSAATTAVLEALLLSPEDDADARSAGDALARMGTRVSHSVHPGLADLLAGDESAPLPPAAIADAVRWLQERATDASVTTGVPEIEDFGTADAGNPALLAAQAATRLETATCAVVALAAGDAPAWMRLRASGTPVRERLVLIAPDRDGAPTLAAALVERDETAAAAPGRRAILLLSSGPERRVGPHRLWVGWARRRAALGDVVLRLDAAGVGDSDPQSPSASGVPGVDDVARALAWLRREQGVGPVVVMGLGAGALDAWHAAQAGIDVAQVVAINPPLAGGAATAADAGGMGHRLRMKWREATRAFGLPVQDDLAGALGRAASRGVALRFVFSRGVAGLSPLRDEAGRQGLVRDGRVQLSEIEHADPTFAGVPARLALQARLDVLLPPTPAAARGMFVS